MICKNTTACDIYESLNNLTLIQINSNLSTPNCVLKNDY